MSESRFTAFSRGQESGFMRASSSSISCHLHASAQLSHKSASLLILQRIIVSKLEFPPTGGGSGAKITREEERGLGEADARFYWPADSL